jgi:Flp pilus assembly protein TadG
VTSLHADQRGIVVSFLIRVLLGIAIVGMVFVEGGSILFTKLRVQDTAESGANSGVGALSTNPGECTAAGTVAAQTVHDKDPEIEITGFTCLPDGRFRITVQKEASTIVVKNISAIEDWALARSTATARPAAPGV